MSKHILRVAEPPPQYMIRAPLVPDSSVLAALLFREPWLAQAESRLIAHELHAPWLLQAELANVAVKKTRKGFGEIAAAGLAALADLRISLYRIDESAVAELAQNYRLSAYDACYLWLAAEIKCPLATFDDTLAAAASEHLAGLS
jgi:predicted nucleic acid-binding protein